MELCNDLVGKVVDEMNIYKLWCMDKEKKGEAAAEWKCQ